MSCTFSRQGSTELRSGAWYLGIGGADVPYAARPTDLAALQDRKAQRERTKWGPNRSATVHPRPLLLQSVLGQQNRNSNACSLCGDADLQYGGQAPSCVVCGRGVLSAAAWLFLRMISPTSSRRPASTPCTAAEQSSPKSQPHPTQPTLSSSAQALRATSLQLQSSTTPLKASPALLQEAPQPQIHNLSARLMWTAAGMQLTC